MAGNMQRTQGAKAIYLAKRQPAYRDGRHTLMATVPDGDGTRWRR